MTTSKTCLLLALATLPLSGFCQDRPLTRAQLPPAVAATADRETHGAQIKGYSTERENGVQEYEVETVVDGHTRDLAVAADGRLLEVEEQVSIDQLPPDARAALMKKAGGGTIAKIEALHKSDRLVAYEAVIRAHGHSHEVQIGPHGQALLHEE